MRAVVIAAPGGPEVLEVRDLPAPTPGPGQVTIDVAYAGVNYVEVMMRRGDPRPAPYPFTPGFEVSGHVRALGEGVGGLRVGQAVAAMTTTGGYAEVAAAPAPLVYPLDGVDLKTGAGFPTVGPAAYGMLAEVARLRPGETVLIQAAAGGVGVVAGQIARHLGAGQVIGTVGSPEKEAFAREYGYGHFVPRAGFVGAVRALTGGAGVDVVLESVGGDVFTESLEALAPLGKLVIFGNASAAPFRPVSPGDLWLASKSVRGWNIGGLGVTDPARVGALARAALGLVAAGHVRIPVTDTLPLAQAAEAHRRLEGRGTVGKLLLEVG